MPEDSHVKLVVQLTGCARGGRRWETEALWATKIDDDLYELRNVPLLVYNLHIGDLVRCRRTDDGQLKVVDVAAQSGAQTLRLFFATEASDEFIEQTLASFEDLPTITEKSTRVFWAVATRSTSDLEMVAERLSRIASDLFAFETGYNPIVPWAPGGGA